MSAAAGAQSIAAGLRVGLVAYWPLNEASGPRADATGRGNTLTQNGSVTQVAGGPLGNAASFPSGSTNFLSSSAADLQMGDIDFTFAGWVSSNKFGGGGTGNWMLGKSGGVFVDYEAAIQSTPADAGSLQFQYYVGGYKTATTPTGSVLVGAWQFVTFWHDATANTVNAQVNAGTITSSPTAGLAPAVTPADIFCLGRRGNPSYHFLGYLQHWGVWKRTLTAVEKTYLYNGGSGRAYPF